MPIGETVERRVGYQRSGIHTHYRYVHRLDYTPSSRALFAETRIFHICMICRIDAKRLHLGFLSTQYVLHQFNLGNLSNT